MRDERARILELLRAGKISVDEAEALLDALEDEGRRGGGQAASAFAAAPARSLCVRITDLRTGRVKVNVRLPPGASTLLSKLTRTKIGRYIGGQALHEIRRAARSGAPGHIVDVSDEHRGERVEIFFE